MCLSFAANPTKIPPLYSYTILGAKMILFQYIGIYFTSLDNKLNRIIVAITNHT